ncbi:MAG: hypothetical protein MJZ37_09985 [Bacilli bacterium]|nr:hypothetical protein [Bacilli bacterium]
MVVFVISLVLLIIFSIFVVVGQVSSVNFIKKAFADNNVIVFGRKGRGKDLIFQTAINLRKKEYYSNLNYGGQYNFGSAKMLDLSPNDYTRLINNDIVVLDKEKYPYEHKDFYFSDGGIIFPSQYDTLLHKQYKTFPVAYALSRQLWNNNIHVNSQSLDRVWKALREQADYYIKCRRTIRLPFHLVVLYTTYEKYRSAEQELNPMPKHTFNKEQRRIYEQYVATNGKIENKFIIISKRNIHYDTRAYHKIIFGFPVSRKGAKVSPLSDDQK